MESWKKAEEKYAYEVCVKLRRPRPEVLVQALRRHVAGVGEGAKNRRKGGGGGGRSTLWVHRSPIQVSFGAARSS